MTVVVLPQAADEFDNAVAYYEAKQSGLGRRFRDNVNRHLHWITGNTLPSLTSALGGHGQQESKSNKGRDGARTRLRRSGPAVPAQK
jgi:hypothetical protein